jgi:hypothetical protein
VSLCVSCAASVETWEFLIKNPNPALLNLLGQVPLIRKVSIPKFSFEVHFSKERTSKKRRKKILENDFQKKFEKKVETLNVSLLIDCLRKRKRTFNPTFFLKRN